MKKLAIRIIFFNAYSRIFKTFVELILNWNYTRDKGGRTFSMKCERSLK